MGEIIPRIDEIRKTPQYQRAWQTTQKQLRPYTGTRYIQEREEEFSDSKNLSPDNIYWDLGVAEALVHSGIHMNDSGNQFVDASRAFNNAMREARGLGYEGVADEVHRVAVENFRKAGSDILKVNGTMRIQKKESLEAALRGLSNTRAFNVSSSRRNSLVAVFFGMAFLSLSIVFAKFTGFVVGVSETTDNMFIIFAFIFVLIAFYFLIRKR